MYSAVFNGSQLAEQRLGTAPAPPSGKKFHQKAKVYFFKKFGSGKLGEKIKSKRIATSEIAKSNVKTLVSSDFFIFPSILIGLFDKNHFLSHTT